MTNTTIRNTNSDHIPGAIEVGTLLVVTDAYGKRPVRAVAVRPSLGGEVTIKITGDPAGATSRGWGTVGRTTSVPLHWTSLAPLFEVVG